MVSLPKLAKAGPVDRYLAGGGLVTLYETHTPIIEDAVFNVPSSQLQDGSLGVAPSAGDIIQIGNVRTLMVHVHSDKDGAADGVAILFFADEDGTIPIVGLPASYPKTLIGFAAATGVLTFSGVAIDTQTVTIDAKVYTFQDTLTDVNGNVQIGIDTEASIQNLFDAINLTGTPGTQYAASMTLHPTVSAVANDATTLSVRAKTPGAAGGLIVTDESLDNAGWGDTTLEGGVDGVDIQEQITVPVCKAMSFSYTNGNVAQGEFDVLIIGRGP